jgi:hypothetical protein
MANGTPHAFSKGPLFCESRYPEFEISGATAGSLHSARIRSCRRGYRLAIRQTASDSRASVRAKRIVTKCDVSSCGFPGCDALWRHAGCPFLSRTFLRAEFFHRSLLDALEIQLASSEQRDFVDEQKAVDRGQP